MQGDLEGRLFYFPNIIGFQKLGEVMILLLSLHLFYLSRYAVVVGGSIHIADDAEGDGETVVVSHQGKLQLQGVVLAMGIMNQDILLGDAVLTNLHHLQTETFLNETELVVRTEDKGLAMFYVDGVLLTGIGLIDSIVTVVIEDDAVLQNLAYGCSLVVVGSFQNLNRSLSISGHGTGKEMTAGSEAELSGTEGIFHRTVR